MSEYEHGVIRLARSHIDNLESRFRGTDSDLFASEIECGRLAIADAEIFLAETPESVGRWVEATFPGGNDRLDRHALRCLRECVEWCVDAGAPAHFIHAVVNEELAKTDHPHDPVFRRERVPWEMADVVIVACGAAHKMGVNLWHYVVEKMKINRSRTWEDHGDGTGQHK
jgi:hypothetical protein